jgi:RNA polymerase sigma-54 factor
MLKPALQLRLGQQLTMTPQLQQAIRLLQLPVMELQAQIHEALETNVMLEAEEDEHVSLDSVDTAELPALNYEQRHEREETVATSADSEPQAEAIDHSGDDNEWTETQLTGPSETPWSGDGDRADEFADAGGETLQDHLLWQLQMSRLTELDKKIGAAIVDAINDDGYLSEPLEEIAQNLKPETVVAVDDIARVLPHIQAMDPAGVGARSVAECIELQLQQLDVATPGRETAITIARNYLDQVADQQWGILRRQLRATEEETDCALALVRACQPRPGAAIHSVPAEYIVPDVFVRRTDHGWAVEVNPATLPKIRVNQSYANLLNRSSDHAMLRTQLQEARWLIRSLEIRNETLLKVARCIVQRQAAFLDNGDEFMQPMILKDVAEAIEMHESTISRVTTNKYMHTPRGVIEFRYFFSSHVSGSDGSELSSTAIRARIKKLIAQEDATKPLSDSRIAEILSQEGAQVARRTVAKYREAIGIAPSSDRKRAANRMQ